MILASYNVENLFQRSVVLNQGSTASAGGTLNRYAQFNTIVTKPKYSPADKRKILTLLGELGLEKSDENKEVILRQNRAHLVKRPKAGPMEVVANGRGDWIGWLELKREAVNEVSTRMTAQVVHDLNADVLAVVEAEDRPGLVRFSRDLLPSLDTKPYEHIMLVDGNDDRGIDVGIMARKGFTLDSVRSHVDDADASGPIFSRDCPEYFIQTKKGNRLVVLVNHLKSKGFGSQADSSAKRLRQAKQIAKIYRALKQAGEDLVDVVGDLNDTPDSAPLAPLLKQGDLRDISEHPTFDDGGRPGTYRSCKAGASSAKAFGEASMVTSSSTTPK